MVDAEGKLDALYLNKK